MLFDSHIHLEQFSDEEIDQILQQPNLSGVLAVATNLASGERLLALNAKYPNVAVAAGFHPEQSLCSADEMERLFEFIACGEVGLVYDNLCPLAAPWFKPSDISLQLTAVIEKLAEIKHIPKMRLLRRYGKNMEIFYLID